RHCYGVVGLVEPVGEGFLAVDVLLRLQALRQLPCVLVVGGGADDGVEPGHGEQVVAAFEDLRFLGGCLRDLRGGELVVARRAIADGDEVGGLVFGGGEEGAQERPAAAAGADDADGQARGGVGAGGRERQAGGGGGAEEGAAGEGG